MILEEVERLLLLMRLRRDNLVASCRVVDRELLVQLAKETVKKCTRKAGSTDQQRRKVAQ